MANGRSRRHRAPSHAHWAPGPGPTLQPEVQGKCHWCARWTFKLRGATTPDSGSGLSTSQARSTSSVPPLGADPEVTFFSRAPILDLRLAGNRGRNPDLGRSPDSRFGQNRPIPDSAAGNGNRGPDWPEIGKSGITPSRVVHSVSPAPPSMGTLGNGQVSGELSGGRMLVGY